MVRTAAGSNKLSGQSSASLLLCVATVPRPSAAKVPFACHPPACLAAMAGILNKLLGRTAAAADEEPGAAQGMHVKEVNIYPIKSCKGMHATRVACERTGRHVQDISTASDHRRAVLTGKVHVFGWQ